MLKLNDASNYFFRYLFLAPVLGIPKKDFEFADVHNIFIASSIACLWFHWISNVNDICMHMPEPANPFI